MCSNPPWRRIFTVCRGMFVLASGRQSIHVLVVTVYGRMLGLENSYLTCESWVGFEPGGVAPCWAAAAAARVKVVRKQLESSRSRKEQHREKQKQHRNRNRTETPLVIHFTASPHYSIVFGNHPLLTRSRASKRIPLVQARIHRKKSSRYEREAL